MTVHLLLPVLRVPPLLGILPYGIDTAEVTMAGREILDTVGYGQKYTNEIMGKLHKIGNTSLARPGTDRYLEGLEEDMLDATGVAVSCARCQGAEVLLVTPSADSLLNSR